MADDEEVHQLNVTSLHEEGFPIKRTGQNSQNRAEQGRTGQQQQQQQQPQQQHQQQSNAIQQQDQTNVTKQQQKLQQQL